MQSPKRKTPSGFRWRGFCLYTKPEGLGKIHYENYVPEVKLTVFKLIGVKIDVGSVRPGVFWPSNASV